MVLIGNIEADLEAGNNPFDKIQAPNRCFDPYDILTQLIELKYGCYDHDRMPAIFRADKEDHHTYERPILLGKPQFAGIRDDTLSVDEYLRTLKKQVYDLHHRLKNCA